MQVYNTDTMKRREEQMRRQKAIELAVVFYKGDSTTELLKFAEAIANFMAAKNS